jgi:hypothetical protein
MPYAIRRKDTKFTCPINGCFRRFVSARGCSQHLKAIHPDHEDESSSSQAPFEGRSTLPAHSAVLSTPQASPRVLHSFDDITNMGPCASPDDGGIEYGPSNFSFDGFGPDSPQSPSAVHIHSPYNSPRRAMLSPPTAGGIATSETYSARKVIYHPHLSGNFSK